MLKTEYNELYDLIRAECDIPDSLFPEDVDNSKYCYFYSGILAAGLFIWTVVMNHLPVMCAKRTRAGRA